LDKVKLGDIADTALGKMLDAKKNKGALHPYLANINVRWGEFDLENLPLMPFEDDENDRFSIRDGDLVMCEGGEPGRCAIWHNELEDVHYQKALHRIRPHEGVDVRWLYYWFLLQSRIGGLNKYFVETTIKHLVGEDLKSVVIDLPDYSEQVATADVLDSLDAKIANNKKLMAELDATARLIYDYWFTQFDFPDKNGNPYRSSGGKMVWSSEMKRDIPVTWTTGCLADIANYSDTSINNEILDAHTYVSTDNMQKNLGGLLPSDYVPASGMSTRFDAYDTLLSNIRPYFKKAYLPFFTGGCCNDVLVIRAIKPSSASYLYLTISRDQFFDYDSKGAKGSKMPRGDKDHIMAYPLVIPSEDILVRFSKWMEPVARTRDELQREDDNLIALRDWLLPMLMNGQAQVTD